MRLQTWRRTRSCLDKAETDGRVQFVTASLFSVFSRTSRSLHSAQHVTSQGQGHVYLSEIPRNDRLGRHARLHSTPHRAIPHLHSSIAPTANYFFFGFGTGVPFELAVVLGVGVALIGALGACGVLCGLLGCTMCIASVSRNAGISQ
jgi:hypothetical protein